MRKSQLLLDRTRRTLSIAVSDSRIFYTTAEFAAVPENGIVPNGASVPAAAITPVTLETLQLRDGALSRLPSQVLRRQNNTFYGYAYGELFARGDLSLPESAQRRRWLGCSHLSESCRSIAHRRACGAHPA